mmetsp:Transcript_13982/g.33520  ORF Transcript_13982/g.33520 Transcript_13982/m.33520 type:complete len:200 (+) Transcript_13982:415-1014(+)
MVWICRAEERLTTPGPSLLCVSCTLDMVRMGSVPRSYTTPGEGISPEVVKDPGRCLSVSAHSVSLRPMSMLAGPGGRGCVSRGLYVCRLCVRPSNRDGRSPSPSSTLEPLRFHLFSGIAVLGRFQMLQMAPETTSFLWPKVDAISQIGHRHRLFAPSASSPPLAAAHRAAGVTRGSGRRGAERATRPWTLGADAGNARR